MAARGKRGAEPIFICMGAWFSSTVSRQPPLEDAQAFFFAGLAACLSSDSAAAGTAAVGSTDARTSLNSCPFFRSLLEGGTFSCLKS